MREGVLLKQSDIQRMLEGIISKMLSIRVIELQLQPKLKILTTETIELLPRTG